MTNSVIESKRFVVRKSLIGKNQVITFTNKKGDKITYNHDKVYSIMKSKLETLPCWNIVCICIRLILFETFH